MAKFKKGQKCRVVKNLLAPQCIGMEVTILGVAGEEDGRVEGGLKGYAAESCLEEVK